MASILGPPVFQNSHLAVQSRPGPRVYSVHLQWNTQSHTRPHHTNAASLRPRALWPLFAGAWSTLKRWFRLPVVGSCFLGSELRSHQVKKPASTLQTRSPTNRQTSCTLNRPNNSPSWKWIQEAESEEN